MKQKNSLIGKIEIQIYDKNDNLKKIVKGKNTVTHKGIKRICEILTQGARSGVSDTESITGIPLNTLKNGQNSIGLNVIEWKEKEYTTFEFSENIDGLQQSSSMFFENYNNSNYSVMSKSKNISDNFDNFYFPNKDKKNDRNTAGWVCDLGLKHAYNHLHLFSSNPSFVERTNVKYNTLTIKTKDGKELIEDRDYSVLDWGDYENYPKLKISEEFFNTELYLNYSYFNVPQVPIVGFCFDSICDNNNSTVAQNFIGGWSWSLDQGKSKLPPFFPNVSGNPSGNANDNMNSTNNYTHQSVWFNPFGETEKRFFIHTYPYAVINPTQLAWFSHLYNNGKCYFKNFSLLGINLPKLGPQAIMLGTGTEQPTPNDLNLTNPVQESKTLIKYKRNNGTDTITFEIKLDFQDCNSENEFTEIGLFFPENEDVFYSDSDYWNNSIEKNGSGKNYENISGKNRIVKFNGINKDKCNALFSHGLFEEPWKKHKDERVTIIYTVKINW